MSSKKRQPTSASFLNQKVQRVKTLVQSKVETATVSEMASDSGSSDNDTLVLFTKECLILTIDVI